MKSPAEAIIENMGGLTRLARSLGFPVSTVQGWKERGKIPQEHWLPIIAVAKEHDLELTFEHFLFPANDPTEAASPTTKESEQAA